jgi:hypothetical protein
LQHFFWKLTSSSSSPSSSIVIVAVRDPFSSFPVTITGDCCLTSLVFSAFGPDQQCSFGIHFFPLLWYFYYCWRLSFLFFWARDIFGSGDSFFIHNASKIR